MVSFPDARFSFWMIETSAEPSPVSFETNALISMNCFLSSPMLISASLPARTIRRGVAILIGFDSSEMSTISNSMMYCETFG